MSAMSASRLRQRHCVAAQRMRLKEVGKREGVVSEATSRTRCDRDRVPKLTSYGEILEQL